MKAIFVLACLLTWMRCPSLAARRVSAQTAIGAAGAAVAAAAASAGRPPAPVPPRELVQNINSSNVHVFLGKQPLLLTFTTPYCSHCQHFEQPLQRIAAVLSKERFSVGKCDVSVQKALGARFSVHGVPAIFLYRDGKMWSYYGPLVAESVIDFATQLYKREKPLDYFNSPVGPVGASKGLMIRVGAVIMRTIPYLQTHLGIPDWAGYILIILAVTGTILVGTFIGVYVTIEHEKAD